MDTPTSPLILIVEDNEMSRDMLSRRLIRRGYRVVTAVNGPEALTSALETLPNLILMDMSLPILDGWECVPQLKENSITAHIPVIALTAHALAGDREKALSIGCDEYETKPIQFERLLIKLATFLSPPT